MAPAKPDKPDRLHAISKITGDIRFIILVLIPLFGWGTYNIPAVKNLVKRNPAPLSTTDVLAPAAVAPVTYDVVIKQLIEKTEANRQRIIKLESYHP